MIQNNAPPDRSMNLSAEPDKQVTDFISHFSAGRTLFLNGACLWFCYILISRFTEDYHFRILYDPIQGHFITHLYNAQYSRYYDVRGDVTAIYRHFKLLQDLDVIRREDRAWYDRLERDCFLFIKKEDE